MAATNDDEEEDDEKEEEEDEDEEPQFRELERMQSMTHEDIVEKIMQLRTTRRSGGRRRGKRRRRRIDERRFDRVRRHEDCDGYRARDASARGSSAFGGRDRVETERLATAAGTRDVFTKIETEDL